jgi:hypothetical protein
MIKAAGNDHELAGCQSSSFIKTYRSAARGGSRSSEIILSDGSTSETVVPCPFSLSIARVPPCRSHWQNLLFWQFGARNSILTLDRSGSE